MEAQELYNEALGLRNYWRPRDRRIAEWLNLEALKDENESAALESMITNDPATVVSLAVHLLTHNPTHHRVLVGGDAGDKIKLQAGKSERCLRSLWRMVDEDALLGGRPPMLREMAWWALTTGWVNVAPFITRDKDGAPRPVLYVHSPLEAYQEFGDDAGLRKYAHIYTTTLADAKDKATRFGTELKATGKNDKPVRIVDYWWLEDGAAWNAVMVSGAGTGVEFLKEPEPFGDSIPVISMPVSGKPRSKQLEGGDDSWKQTLGQSILEKNRPVYKQVNRYLSLLAQLALDAAQPPWLVKGAGIRVTEAELRRGAPRLGGSIIATQNPNASLQRVDPGRFPLEVQQFMSILDGMAQRGGFPYLMYGGVMQQLSGFAINQLMGAAFHQVGPFQDALQTLVSSIDKRWLESIRDGDYAPLTIAGKERGGRESGWYVEDFKKSDIPRRLFVVAEVELSLPSDVIERMAIIRQAIPSGPILDRFTALEEVLKVQDPALVIKRLHEDAVDFNPITQQIEMVTTLRAKANELREIGGAGNRQTADLLDQFADYTLQLMQQQFAASGPARSGQGIRPEALPPEAQGISPDIRRAILRQPAETPNRTRAEQLRQMGIA